MMKKVPISHHWHSAKLVQSLKHRRSQQVIAIVAVFIVGGIGIYFLTASHATTPFVALEAENGVLGNSAQKVASTSASGGNYVEFPPDNTVTRDAAVWPFSWQSPWNMPIGTGAQYAASSDISGSNYVNQINTDHFSHPVYIATDSSTESTVTSDGEEGDDSSQFPVTLRIPSNAAPSQGCYDGSDNCSESGGDHHMEIVNPTHTTVDEFYHTAGSVPNFQAAQHNSISLSGTGVLTGGDRAYYGSGMAGEIRDWDIQQGKIQHALAIAISTDQAAHPWVWPAGSDDTGTNYGGSIPLGSLVAIPRSVKLSSLGLNAGGLMLATALQNYGGIIDDTASGTTMYGEYDAYSNATIQQMQSDYATIVSKLELVTNAATSQSALNSAGAQGGGTPLTSYAPATFETFK